MMKNENKKPPANPNNIGKILPNAAATAVNWNKRLDRRRLKARRTASAITMPAKGAMNMVKNPIRDAIRLPIYARIAAIAKATK